MTIRALHRLRICIATLALVVVGEASAYDCPGCLLTVSANVHLTNLHPDVVQIDVGCTTPNGYDGAPYREGVTVTNRGFSGTVTRKLNFRPVANQTSVVITCELWVQLKNSGWDRAVASAAQPVSVTDENGFVVAAGSTIKWTQAVTFPNAAAPLQSPTIAPR